MSRAMADGRRADGERRRQRVKTAIRQATGNGTAISVSGIARQAGVDRTFLYRHRDLLALIHAAERQPSASEPGAGPPVSLASLQADLANAHARNTRLVSQTQRLERRLAELMGEQAWRESGLGAPADQEELQRQVSRLEQANTELLARLEERDAELEAARAANRELTRAMNQKGTAHR
ncbi:MULTISPECIES: DUF6262 family protein [Streptomyces]|uniref:DUF6262 family protein n=1 Tax=Streptomyces TaxID=1883 RepID=UPI000BC7C647|nr:DUF6262 family protein [Streptomyces sp. Ag109_G2-15]SOE06568.1 hypothetical protein SAMN06272765_7400 [Streptomyces sp. Ag109_G2-15]